MSVGLKTSILFHTFFILSSFLYISQVGNLAVTERVITVDLVKIKSGASTNLKNSPISVKDKQAQKNISASTNVKAPSPIKMEVANAKAPPKNPLATPPPISAPKKGRNNVKREAEEILDDLEKSFPAESQSDIKSMSKATKENLATSDKPYDKSLPLTMAERDNIKMQIERKFFNPIVLDFNPGEIMIKIKLDMRPNGEIEKITVLKSSFYTTRYLDAFIALKDSLVRAANMASPLQGLDEARYEGREGWKEIELVFDAYYLMHT